MFFMEKIGFQDHTVRTKVTIVYSVDFNVQTVSPSWDGSYNGSYDSVQILKLYIFKADEYPNDQSMWRWQFGPALHFRFEGKPDPTPLHFM